MFPTPELESERNEFEDNYFKYLTYAKKILKDIPQVPIVVHSEQQVESQSQRRIAQLENELKA